MLDNPWVNLPEEPDYILPEDLECIQRHRNLPNLHLETVPGQFIGGLNTAEVIFLLLNPGFVPEDETVNLRLPGFLKDNRLNHTDPYNSPFYYFNEGNEMTSGYEWWAQRLKPLILEDGISEETLRTKIMAIEYFPYHSVTYKPVGIIPSQHFAFDLVHEAMRQNKIIVIMRSKKEWYQAVSGLENYDRKMIIKNPRQPYISIGNLGEDNFRTIVQKLINP
jgi:hypothetical protein